ncbi:MAG: hypothetical protein AAF558_04520 [Verrucomicrobiota bacterium]
MIVHASCRDRLTPEDFQFVIESLSRDREDRLSLKELLIDEEHRDSILDLDPVYQSLMESPDFIRVSPHLYFYVLTRRALKQSDIDDRILADYIASLLVAFTRRAGRRVPGSQLWPYLSDLLIQMSKVGPSERFLLRAQVADTTLFLSGIFAQRVQAVCERRGGPNLSFYEQMGQSNYYYASRDKRAEEGSLNETFEKLSYYFKEVRLALNSMSEGCLHMSAEDQWAGSIINDFSS